MSVFFKKYFWTVNLVFIAGLAWLVASTANSVTSSKLFTAPEPPASERVDSSGTPAALAGRVAGDEDAAQTLTARRVFDLRATDDEPVEDDGDSSDEAEETDETPEGELEESELPIDLMGTMVGADAETSMATLTVEGESKLAWVGSEFLDGKARIVAIAPRHVIVREGAGLKVVKLWSDKTAQATKKPPGRFGAPGGRSARPSPAPSVSSRSTSKRKDYSKGVKKTGAYDYEIDRAMIDEQLQDLSSLGTQARVVPNYRNGKYEGFKLVGVRPGSLYRAIGIRSGDVIKSVNNKPIDSPQKALELFEQFKASNALVIDIERRGRPQALNFAIK